MVGSGKVLESTSYLENLVAATIFLLGRFKTGMQVFHYLDEPVMSTEHLVSQIYQLLGKRRSNFRVPLLIAKPVAKVADVVADVTRIDFPITSSRIEKFCTDTYFDSAKIREIGFRQPVDMETALSKTVDWYMKSYVTSN